MTSMRPVRRVVSAAALSSAAVTIAVAVAAVRIPAPLSAAWSAECSARPGPYQRKRPGSNPGFFYSGADRFVHSACPAVSFTNLSPPDVSLHISASLSAGDRLLARGLSQRLVDAVLPARTTLLKVLQHVPVDTQRDQFLDAGNGYRLRRRLHHLGGGALERRFGLGARIVQGSRSPRLIGHYQIPSNSAVDK